MQEAVSSGVVTCGTNCVRGEWRLAHSVVAVLQRGARSVGRWLTFFAGFRFDSVSTADDEDALLDLELMPQGRNVGGAVCGCGGGGCRVCREPRADPGPPDHCTDGVRCGCICALKRRSAKVPDAPPGPIAEGRFTRGGHTPSRDSRGQPSVVPEFGASLAGFGSQQMDFMGVVLGMDLETLSPHRPQATTPKNPFVDFGMPMEGQPAMDMPQGGSRAARPGPVDDDPHARPLDMPAVDGASTDADLPRRGPARAVGKALRSAASKFGGASTSPERKQPSRRTLTAVQPPRGAALEDPLSGDGAAEDSQDPVVITIPDEEEAVPAAANAAATHPDPLERRSPFEGVDHSAQHAARGSSRLRTSQTEGAGSGAGRRESEAGSGGALACTMDLRRTNLQRSLALSQRSLSRMSIAETTAGPPADWCGPPRCARAVQACIAPAVHLYARVCTDTTWHGCAGSAGGS